MRPEHDERHWRTAKRCSSGACVEIATAPGAAFMRNSANPAGPMLSVPAPAWTAFIEAIKSGHLHAETRKRAARS